MSFATTNSHPPSFNHSNSDLGSSDASTSHARGNRRGPKCSKRYAPYLIPQHALYQLNVTFLNPTYVEGLVEIIRPRVHHTPLLGPSVLNTVLQSPKQVLVDALEPGPPPPDLHVVDRIEEERDIERDVERGRVHQVFAWFIDVLGSIKRAILGAA
ncbi:hypothetical protein Hypma_015078 [Hypsizygus marmoreus]|uniref:Uncharacterized protein n=1 Tax=Hypsizygus marmoreus TaxID=39966 RepID=A0A369KC88_HYPMA|nr:hypothetical protein Hypma_015078 [Hypsizygus marmoreus]